MGLDAAVYCDCVEKGRLKTPHPFPNLLCICENGMPEIKSETSRKQTLHDKWMTDSPCEHEELTLSNHYLGNAFWIGSLRGNLDLVSRNAEKEFPILCSKVIYSGTHTGDFLSLDDVRILNDEIKNLYKKLPAFRKQNVEDLEGLEQFLTQMSELVEASLKVSKPIAF